MVKAHKVGVIRTAVAEYMQSEGCSCCRDYEKHKEDEKRLAELLNVPAYPDGSGYDFPRFTKGRQSYQEIMEK